jgi:hypothetical protein
MAYNSYSDYNRFVKCCKPTGLQGIEGKKGEIGYTGPPGPRGYYGCKGSPGANSGYWKYEILQNSVNPRSTYIGLSENPTNYGEIIDLYIHVNGVTPMGNTIQYQNWLDILDDHVNKFGKATILLISNDNCWWTGVSGEHICSVCDSTTPDASCNHFPTFLNATVNSITEIKRVDTQQNVKKLSITVDAIGGESLDFATCKNIIFSYMLHGKQGLPGLPASNTNYWRYTEQEPLNSGDLFFPPGDIAANEMFTFSVSKYGKLLDRWGDTEINYKKWLDALLNHYNKAVENDVSCNAAIITLNSNILYDQSLNHVEDVYKFINGSIEYITVSGDIYEIKIKILSHNSTLNRQFEMGESIMMSYVLNGFTIDNTQKYDLEHTSVFSFHSNLDGKSTQYLYNKPSKSLHSDTWDPAGDDFDLSGNNIQFILPVWQMTRGVSTGYKFKMSLMPMIDLPTANISNDNTKYLTNMTVTNNRIGYVMTHDGHVINYTVEGAEYTPDACIDAAHECYEERFKLGILDASGIEYAGRLSYDTVDISNEILSGSECFVPELSVGATKALSFKKGQYLVLFTYGSYFNVVGEHITDSVFTGDVSVTVTVAFHKETHD